MNMFLSFAILVLLGGLLNFLRFYVPPRYGDLLLVLGCLGAMEIDAALVGTRALPVLLLLFTALCAARFYRFGGIVGACLSMGLLLLQTELPPKVLALHLLLHAGLAFGFAALRKRLDRDRSNKARFETQQYRQSKQLNIIREVSNVFQSTLDYDQLQHVILTVVTAGYGLGFNRAMLFLVSEDGQRLEGSRGIGSMTQEEGLRTWVDIVSGNLRMRDFLNLKEESQAKDRPLQEQVAAVSYPIREAGFLSEALLKGKPALYRTVDRRDRLAAELEDGFGLTPFAVIPLLAHGIPVGVLLVDNNINLEPITYQDLDAAIPIADQAASALRNALAYKRNSDFAITDGLTGLYNQRHFQSMLEHWIHESSGLSLLILDIDHFKHYNDTNGHPAGNETLIRFANTLTACVKDMGMVFRFGGEEFVILLPSVEPDEAMGIAEKIRADVEYGSYYNGHLQPGGRLTVSIGAAHAPLHRRRAEELLEAADSAVYQAKRSGRNRVVLYGEGEGFHDVGSAI